MTDLDGPAFNSLFDTFRHTVVRLETLPAYSVGGAEALRLEAHREGRARPERSVRTDPWLGRIAVSTVLNGKAWRRVRVFDDPPTDYQHQQVESYREAQAVGDEVLIASRPDVGETGSDVWVFDAGHRDAHAVVMHYRPDGAVDRRELVTDAAQVAGFVAGVERVASHAVALNEWLARAGVRVVA